MISADLRVVYDFGAYSLDPAERLIVREGRPVALPPKSFDLLVYLLEHPGRLLEKRTLMVALWPDSFVEEANLSYQINLLRKALDADGAGGPLIQTVPKVGYRFIGPVTRRTRVSVEPEPSSATDALAHPATSGTRRGFVRLCRLLTTWLES